MYVYKGYYTFHSIVLIYIDINEGGIESVAEHKIRNALHSTLYYIFPFPMCRHKFGTDGQNCRVLW